MAADIREKEQLEYLFLDLEWNQALGTTGLDGREAIQIGVVAADTNIQKTKTFSKAIRLSDPSLFNEKTEIVTHTPITNIMQGKEIVLSVNHICKSFYDNQVLQNVSIALTKGEILAILGENGAGKSTFVSYVCGLMKKNKGTFLLDGKKQTAKERVQKSYLVMQEVNHQLFSDSVREEIVLGNRDSSENSLQKIMETLDISVLTERHPMTLSGGQKQRVIIASAMFCGKKIPYFDEPTSGLDFSHMMQTCQLLNQLHGEDVFVFIITHDYELIASVCDSVIHIEHGKLFEQYDLDANGIQKLKSFFTQCARNTI